MTTMVTVMTMIGMAHITTYDIIPYKETTKTLIIGRANILFLLFYGLLIHSQSDFETLTISHTDSVQDEQKKKS